MGSQIIDYSLSPIRLSVIALVYCIFLKRFPHIAKREICHYLKILSIVFSATLHYLNN